MLAIEEELSVRRRPRQSTLRRPARADGRGMVTAELAVATLAAFALLIMMCSGVYLVITQVRCGDAAAAVARQVARGDTSAVAKARASAPEGATVRIQRTPNLVTVTVAVTARPLAKFLTGVPLTAQADVIPEPK